MINRRILFCEMFSNVYFVVKKKQQQRITDVLDSFSFLSSKRLPVDHINYNNVKCKMF